MIHILYDPRKDDSELIEELQRQNIDDYCFWYPVRASTVMQSINLSHKQIVRYLKEKNVPRGTIFEEDVCFPSNIGYEYFLQERGAAESEEMDIFLGGAYACRFPPERPVVNGWRGLHCYTIYACYYDTFLGLPDNDHIDKLVSESAITNLCYPMAALQRPGISANQRGYVNYNGALREQDIYF